jgi:hypothetical protein
MTAPALQVDPYFRQRLAAVEPPCANDTKALIADAVLSKLTKRPMLLPEQTGQDSVRNVVDTSHASSCAVSIRPKEVAVSFPSTGRITPEQDRITKPHATSAIARALQAWGMDKSAPIARVGHIAGVDRKTAAAWYYGKASPQSEHLLTLARKIPELKAEVRRLLGLEQDHAESFQREAIALLQRYAR